MAKFKLDDGSEYLAEDFVDGYLVNPLLLRGTTPTEPFILRTDHVMSVHCLVGGSLRCWGVFDRLDDALACAKTGPSWRTKSYAERQIREKASMIR